MRLRLCMLGCAAVAAAIAAAPAPAAPGAATFAVIPEHYDPSLRATQSYFVADLRPGQTYTNSVRIRNLGNQTGTALLYAVDATTGQTSGAVYLDHAKPRQDVGAWVTLGASSVTLGPGQSKTIPVTVRVPVAARPGDHLGGIVAENTALTGASSKGALRIRIRHLTIAAVLVQVPGSRSASMKIGGVKAGGEHGYQYVYVNLRNTGALATKPSGRLLISDSNGKQVASRNFQLDTFLPGTAIGYPVLLPAQALQPGNYIGKVELTYSAAALGYRQTAGASQTITGSYPFKITSNQYKTVFRGVNPVRPVQKASAGGGSMSLLVLVAAALAVLLTALVALVVVLRRWPVR